MIEAFGASDVGCVRTNNEDYFLISTKAGLYLVADGMGGAKAGETASRVASETVRDFVEATPNASADTLSQAVQEANQQVKILSQANSEMRGMGTTLTAVLATDHGLNIVSVGDSRAYSLRGGELTQITRDQSWVNEVGRKLGLAESALVTHPMRHVLTMAVGVADNLRVNTYTVPLEPGMLVLLSSDGLHGVITPAQITSILSGPGALSDKCGLLIQAARDRGGPDNITAVLISAS